jgi:pseudouridylate synthase
MMINRQVPASIVLGMDVARALRSDLPVVALESAVITHGLPRPENLLLAQALEQEIRDQDVTPATVALMDGRVHIGITPDQLERLANEDGSRKIGRRDFGIALARKENGGTTVAGTLIAARSAGIRVFATGGIGGVHRQAPFDVSGDLPELGRSPLVVVCAGAKAILDLPATMEYLETMGVPILGYQTEAFPAFYSRESGLKVNARVDSPAEIARIAKAQWDLGIESALLVVQPPPEEVALPSAEVERMIAQALEEAAAQKMRGAAVTPFLLDRVSKLSGGASLQANLALLRNNAHLAAKIAAELRPRRVI